MSIFFIVNYKKVSVSVWFWIYRMLHIDCVKCVYATISIFLRQKCFTCKNGRCHVTPLPTHNDNLSTMATFLCPQGGGYKEFWLDVSEMIKENAAMCAFLCYFYMNTKSGLSYWWSHWRKRTSLCLGCQWCSDDNLWVAMLSHWQHSNELPSQETIQLCLCKKKHLLSTAY